MRTRLALVVLVIAGAIVAVVIMLPGPERPEPPSPAPLPEPPVGSPREVVVAYIQALESRDFQGAYKHLSADSREARPYAEFVDLCEKTGVTAYDLSSATEQPAEGDRVTVTVQLVEDPAEAGFVTVKEGQGWKVVFIGGIPSFPYPSLE